MENIELIFENIQAKNLEKLLFEDLSIQKEKIKTSHFYDNEEKKDLEFKDVVSLEEYFSRPGTGNIFLEEVDIGTIISNVIIVISFDEVYGDVVINFPSNEILNTEKRLERKKYEAVLKKILLIYKNIDMSKVLLGYEPAEDEDMLICRIDENGVYESNSNH